MRSILAIGVLTCSIALVGCDNKPNAPFGFKWGQTVDDIKKENLPGFEVHGDSGLVQFVTVKNAPSDAYDASSFHLSFMPINGLTGITMFSKGVDASSYYFNDGKTLYNKLAAMLEEKYGKPVKVNEKVTKDGDDFYFCVQDKSCGSWTREYEKDGVHVELTVKSSPGIPVAHQPKGYIQVTYDYFTDDMKNKEKAAYEAKDKQKSDAAKKNNY